MASMESGMTMGAGATTGMGPGRPRLEHHRWAWVVALATISLAAACSSGAAHLRETRAGAATTSTQPVATTPVETTAPPSPPHRTGDVCGAELVLDATGYLEGRHDAEAGRPYQVDGAPAPSPDDEDDDDATVGPQTRYRAGYAQGWCDGGGQR